jgi:WXG100 family type VII secretion target
MVWRVRGVIRSDLVMSKAHVDPADLRRFANDLKRFTVELEGLMGQLHSRMANLETTWRDQEQRKFAEAFSQTAKSLATFVEAAGEHANFLNKKATLVEQYLRQR